MLTDSEQASAPTTIEEKVVEAILAPSDSWFVLNSALKVKEYAAPIDASSDESSENIDFDWPSIVDAWHSELL
jgi:hypothetical protein